MDWEISPRARALRALQAERALAREVIHDITYSPGARQHARDIAVVLHTALTAGWPDPHP